MMCVDSTIYTQRLYSTCIIIIVIVVNTTSAKLMGEYEKLKKGTVKMYCIYMYNSVIYTCMYTRIHIHNYMIIITYMYRFHMLR